MKRSKKLSLVQNRVIAIGRIRATSIYLWTTLRSRRIIVLVIAIRQWMMTMMMRGLLHVKMMNKKKKLLRLKSIHFGMVTKLKLMLTLKIS